MRKNCFLTRAILIIAFFSLFYSVRVSAQEKEINRWSNTVEFSFIRNFNDFKHLSFFEVTASPGFKFNDRFSLRVPVEVSLGLFNQSTTKNYDILGTLGLTGACNIIKSDKFRFEFNLSAGSTYFKSDWSYLYGNATFRFGFSSLGPINPYIGIGVKYYHPYHQVKADIVSLPITFGIWMF